MLVFRRLHLNLLSIVVLLILKVVIGYHPTRIEKLRLSSNINCQIKTSKKQEYCGPKFLWRIKIESLTDYSSSLWYYQVKTIDEKRTHETSLKRIMTWKIPSLFVSRPRQLKFPEIRPYMSQIPPLVSFFKWILHFSMLKEYVDLIRLLWLYVLILQTPLGFHTIANGRLLTPKNSL